MSTPASVSIPPLPNAQLIPSQMPPLPIYQMQPGLELPIEPTEPAAPDLDEELAKLTPYVWVTYLMIAINVGVFLAMVACGVSWVKPTPDQLAEWGGGNPLFNYAGECWRFLTACFVHSGIEHLLGNMLFLYLLGPRTERTVGPWGFLFAYLLGGLFGAITSTVVNPVVGVGASGAVYAVVGIQFAIIFTQSQTPLKNLANVGILIFLSYGLVNGFFSPGVDNAAHVGGLVAGLLCGLILTQPIEESSVGYRWLRNSALVACGTVAILVGYATGQRLALPTMELARANIEFTSVLKETDKVETQVNVTLNDAKRKLHALQINELEVGQILEKDVLPLWRDLVVKLHKTTEPSYHFTTFRKLLTKYAETRLVYLELSSQACKETDPVKKMWKSQEVVEARKVFETHLAEVQSLLQNGQKESALGFRR